MEHDIEQNTESQEAVVKIAGPSPAQESGVYSSTGRVFWQTLDVMRET